VNAYEVRQAWCLLQVKLCDPCLSALKWSVYHASAIQVLGFTSALPFTYINNVFRLYLMGATFLPCFDLCLKLRTF